MNLKVLDFFLLRIPTFSINKLMELNSYINDRDIESIKNIFSNELFLKSIYLSSRYFYGVATEWLKNSEITFDEKDKVLNTLYKYYIRMSYRCTPYGLFAGFSLGEISNKETQVHFHKNHIVPNIRIDFQSLTMIKNLLLSNKNILKNVKFFPNNTLYHIKNTIRYIEWDDNFDHSISEIEINDLLNEIISKANEGITYLELIELILRKEKDLPIEEIEYFINSLFEAKLLVDRLPPFLTESGNQLDKLVKCIGLENIDTQTKDLINDINAIIYKENIDINEIEKLYQYNVFNDNTQIFQVDTTIKTDKININTKIANKIASSINDLKSIAFNNQESRLDLFKKRFFEKYEYREVSLVEVLDPTLGIGYGEQISGNIEELPLIKDIYLSDTVKEKNEISPIIKTILNKYLDVFFMKNRENIIQLTDEDIKSSSTHQSNKKYADNYFIFGDLIINNEGEINENNFKFINKAALPEPNINAILSRFAYYDEALVEHIKKSYKYSDNVVYAEVVNSTKGRIGNVLLRPSFFQYEIPYTAETKKDKIPVEDITISIINDDIILKSKKLNKQIRPIISTAYNYSKDNLPLIRFLGDLQYYKVYNGFYWNWGVLEDMEFLPRVEYKDIILSEARWRLKNGDYSIDKFNSILQTKKIPRYCTYKENDNVLLLDTHNYLSKNFLILKLKNQDILLYETFIDKTFIKKGNSNYMGEIIIPISPDEDNKIELNNQILEDIKRNFIIGEEWTYFKIYCNHKAGDHIITEILNPLMKDLSKNNNHKWFFIRYNLPENHIRFRLNKKLDIDLIDRFNDYSKQSINNGLIQKVQIDTYIREIEKYSIFGIENTESLFYYDSVAISEFIRMNDDENTKWIVALASIDMLMDDFNINIEDRINLFESLYKSFISEYINESEIKFFNKSINHKYLKYKQEIERIIYDKDIYFIREYMLHFIKRSENIKSINMHFKNDNKELIFNFLRNIIHMSLNRFFFTKQRLQELIIYTLLYKGYKSKFLRNGIK